ncbi:MAG: alpha/beta fold hydrolase, partial [Ornithinimicrobium sp.]
MTPAAGAFIDLLGARVHWVDFEVAPGWESGTPPESALGSAPGSESGTESESAPGWAEEGVDSERSAQALCVLVHGLGGSTVNWESLVPLLGPRLRCVAFDLVGFGMTDAGSRTASVGDNTDLLAAFVERIRATHPDLPLLLIGNSMGGLLSARYAAREVSDVAGVVLLDPTVPPAGLLPGPGGVLAAGLYAVPPVGQAAA